MTDYAELERRLREDAAGYETTSEVFSGEEHSAIAHRLARMSKQRATTAREAADAIAALSKQVEDEQGASRVHYTALLRAEEALTSLRAEVERLLKAERLLAACRPDESTGDVKAYAHWGMEIVAAKAALANILSTDREGKP